MKNLILSVFPGIDLLGRAFEEQGFCVVRGPDVLWGGDVREFHPPARVFGGVIGGPPCQAFSQMRYLNTNIGKCGNLIPEFERVVFEAQPGWFLMENVPAAPIPAVDGYIVHSFVLNNRWLGEAQERTRRFSFGSHEGSELIVEVALFESPEYRQAVTSSLRAVPIKLTHGRDGVLRPKRTYTEDRRRHGPDQGRRAQFSEMCVYQGMPADFLTESPFTMAGKRVLIGNAVPMPMGRAIAEAVRRAICPI